MPECPLSTGVASVIVLLIAIGLFFFWITMLADWAKRTFKHRIDKILWLLALIFLQTIGAFIYWRLVQRKS